ncbi:MAG: hypothetical protein IKQ96_06635 [Lachnospiraceae bacterium]|nr:hypothetical protein [Lachnospiraceae bacterium]
MPNFVAAARELRSNEAARLLSWYVQQRAALHGRFCFTLEAHTPLFLPVFAPATHAAS